MRHTTTNKEHNYLLDLIVVLDLNYGSPYENSYFAMHGDVVQ